VIGTRILCPTCRRFIPGLGRVGNEIIREHDLARGVRCDGSGLPWLAVEARASREGPVSVMGGAA